MRKLFLLNLCVFFVFIFSSCGGNVVSLSKLLGHSSLDITQNYINLLVSDAAKQVDEINVLDKFYSRTHISLRSKS